MSILPQFARQFYTAQWYRDSTMEAEKATKKLTENAAKKPPSAPRVASRVNAKRSRRKADDDDDDDDEDDDADDDDDDDESKDDDEKELSRKAETELDAVKEIQQKAERRKAFLMHLISTRFQRVSNFKWAAREIIAYLFHMCILAIFTCVPVENHVFACFSNC